MINNIAHYKILFFLSWISLYLVYPTWISLHSIVQVKIFPSLDDTLARSFVILGFLIYFSVSAYVISRYIDKLNADKPSIIKVKDWPQHFKDNLGLVIVCCLSVLLHIYTISSVVVATWGGEVPYLRQTVWMYDALNRYWHGFINFPMQYFFWLFIVLVILIIKQKKMLSYVANYINDRPSIYKSKNLIKIFSFFSICILFNMYSYLFPYYSWSESLPLLRYPPVSRILYLTTYSLFGTSHIGPRIVQLFFYILGAVYLYKTVNLFREKETALLAAVIYMFSPIIFSYSSRAALASGTVFFIIIISYCFLRFIRDEDDRYLILTAYFIGIGFLYKRVILVMFIVCFTYLVLRSLIRQDWSTILHFKVLLLSLIPVIPFMMIGKQGLNVYKPVWSYLLSPDKIIAYFLMIQSQISWIIFFMFILSLIYILYAKRDDLSLFFGLLFMGYASFFLLSEVGTINYRYSMALYPAIAVFSAQLLFYITQIIRWRHAFMLVFSVITIYMVTISMIPRASSNLITYKYKDFESQYYPIDKATDWIRDRTKRTDKILSLFIHGYEFYLDRIYGDGDIIYQDRFQFDYNDRIKKLIYSVKDLKKYCINNNISYLMFPYSPKNTLPPLGGYKEMDEMTRYLKENGDNEFIEVAIFNLDDNYIVIYKPKEIRTYVKE